MNITEILAIIGVSGWLPIIIFILCLVDGFFPPVPSESAVMAGLALALTAGARPSFIVTILIAAALGAASGDSIAYAIGRTVGTERWGWMRRPRVRAALDWAARQVSARPALLIVGARYIPIGRVAVNMTAGATRLPYRRFLPLSLAAGAMWAAMCWVLATVVSAWLGTDPVLTTIVSIGVSLVIGVLIDAVTRVVKVIRTHLPRAAHALPTAPAGRAQSDAAALID